MFGLTRNMFSKILSRNFSAQIYSSAAEALSDLKSGCTVAVGGFGNSGAPENLVEQISKMPIRDLTIFANDCATEGYGLSLLLNNQQIKRLVASYLGDNESFEKEYLKGTFELEITPQGTLAEKMRAGGAGIPAFFTRTGYGTMISEGNFPVKYRDNGNSVETYSTKKETREINGKQYVLEYSLTADFSLVKAWKADKLGNLVYRGSAMNFNPLAAMCGSTTVAEVEEVVEPGELSPGEIHTPACYVDRIIKPSTFKKPIQNLTLSKGGGVEIPGSEETRKNRERIIRRAACELKEGMFVNLGIGMPTLISSFVPKNTNVYFQSENGILGMGPFPREGEEDPDLINAGKQTVTTVKGASLFDSSSSFSMIRGGHIQLSVLGGLQVSKEGDLANWIIPGKKVKGMGGAMDLVASPSKHVVTMEHTAGDKKKLLNKCTLPLTGYRVVDLLITELGVFDFKREGITLTEISDGVDIETIKRNTECEFKVASDLTTMKQV